MIGTPPHLSRYTHRETVRRLTGALLLLILVIALGTVGYMLVENWDFLDSLYMTVIGVTSIGYGEVHPLKNTGKVFTIILSLIGVGAAAYAVSVVASIVVGGHLLRAIRGRTMERQIDQITNHIILCGCGKVGECVLAELLASGETVVVIDSSRDICDDLTSKEIPCICDDATIESILERAGVKRAKGLITSLSNDADNVFVTLTARGLSPHLCIVARAAHKGSEKKLVRAGANRVIFANEVAGRHMADFMLRPEAVRFVSELTGLWNREIGLREIAITRNCEWDGKTLEQAQIRAKTNLNVVAIRHASGELIVTPGPLTSMAEGDVAIVFGPVKFANELDAQFTRKT